MICMTFISMTGPIFVPPGILQWILDRWSLLENVYSLHWVSTPPCPSCKLGFAMKLSYVLIFFHNIKSQIIEIWLCMGMSPNVVKLPLKPLPVALIGLGVHTKDCTSPACTLSINILDLYFLLIQRKSGLFAVSRFVLITPTRNCSVDTELIRREYDLEQQFGIRRFSVEVYGCFPLLCRRIPRLNALILVKTGLVSLKFCTIFAALEFHFPSGLQFLAPYHFISFPGPINVLWPCGNCCAYNFTLSEFEIQVSSTFPFSHSMSLNIDMNMILSENRSGSTFWHCKSFWISCKICNVVNPGKYSTRLQLLHHRFHKNSYAAQYILNSFTWLYHFSLASFLEELIFLRHSPESE